MADFGKILDQWEHRDVSAPRPQGPYSRESRNDMDAWLDQYPPSDKDSEAVSEDGSAVVRPEKVPVDDSIDLHGYRLDEAITATSVFIDQSIHRGHRKVVVIHGKGADGQGVLKQQVRVFLH